MEWVANGACAWCISLVWMIAFLSYVLKPCDTAWGVASPIQPSLLSVENSNASLEVPHFFKEERMENMKVHCSERLPVHVARGLQRSGVLPVDSTGSAAHEL